MEHKNPQICPVHGTPMKLKLVPDYPLSSVLHRTIWRSTPVTCQACGFQFTTTDKILRADSLCGSCWRELKNLEQRP